MKGPRADEWKPVGNFGAMVVVMDYSRLVDLLATRMF